MTVAEAAAAIQQSLEVLRVARERDADLDEIRQLEEDLDKAEAAYYNAWLER